MKNFLKYLLFFLISLFFTACSSNNFQYIAKDIKKYPQTANYYTKNLSNLNIKTQSKLDKKFNKLYFAPWHKSKLKAKLEDVTWQFMYAKKKVYGDNLKPLKKSWFKKQISNSNFEKYNTLLRKAIVLQNSNLRLFPTESKIFYNPKTAGEGFPFDYNQNAGIKINTPILISHFTKDRAYAYVEAPFAKGFIKSSHIAFINKKQRDIFENSKLFVSVRDNFPIYKKGFFKEYIKLGTIFAKYKNRFLNFEKNSLNQAVIDYIDISKSFIKQKPIKFNEENINQIANELLGEKYGWGEALSLRDCSAMTKDFFAPFGIYLNRNSYGQTFNGKYLDISKLNPKEKEDFILKNAKPFLSLAYLKGHIMLYVGEDKGKALFLHNIWGVKTKDIFLNEGRAIIGKAIISSLYLGEELKTYDKDKTLINKVLGLVNLVEEK